MTSTQNYYQDAQQVRDLLWVALMQNESQVPDIGWSRIPSLAVVEEEYEDEKNWMAAYNNADPSYITVKTIIARLATRGALTGSIIILAYNLADSGLPYLDDWGCGAAGDRDGWFGFADVSEKIYAAMGMKVLLV